MKKLQTGNVRTGTLLERKVRRIVSERNLKKKKRTEKSGGGEGIMNISKQKFTTGVMRHHVFERKQEKGQP